MELTIEREGDHYIVNGRKWWSSGTQEQILCQEKINYRDVKLKYCVWVKCLQWV